MVSLLSVGDVFAAWALVKTDVCALVLIGSRSRSSSEPTAADYNSDWDYQVVTEDPDFFENSSWVKDLREGLPLAYVVRPGRLGGILKVTIVLKRGELDLVLLPARRLRLARLLVEVQMHRLSERFSKGLSNLSTVLRGGFRVLKGDSRWASFFERVSTEIPCKQICNCEVLAIAEEFVCESVSTRRKISRGEYLAAQRWLHCRLGEFNLCLLNEVRRRQKKASVYDARRIEAILTSQEVRVVAISAIPNRDELTAALTRSNLALQYLMKALVGEDWKWPFEDSRITEGKSIFDV